MLKLRVVSGLLLVLLGITMIFLGQRAGILAPTITGVGFFVIAAVFLADGLPGRRRDGDS